MIEYIKCIICKVTYNTTIHTYNSVAKVDQRGAAALKKSVLQESLALIHQVYPTQRLYIDCID